MMLLNEHHEISQGPVEINISDCMTYMTSNADLNVFVQDEFVTKYWDVIKKLAMADETVLLFERLDNGDLCVYILISFLYNTNTEYITKHQDRLTKQHGVTLITSHC